MAFKYRLHLFFVILTILPLLVAGWVIQGIAIDGRYASADRKLSSALERAGDNYKAASLRGGRLLRRITSDPDLPRAVATSSRVLASAIYDRAKSDDTGSGVSASITDLKGTRIAGEAPPTEGQIVGKPVPVGRKKGRGKGSVTVTLDPAELVALPSPDSSSATNGVIVGWASDGRLLTGDRRDSFAPVAPGKAVTRTFGKVAYRVASVPLTGISQQLVALSPKAPLDAAIRSIRLRTLAVIGTVALLAALLSGLLVRSLTATLRTFAAGARAVAQGRFDERLPVRGSDEFAQFGAAFNDMTTQLEARVEELESERRRVQEFGLRFGEALASTHDVAGLLGIVLDSAMQLAGAQGGRLLVADEGSDVLVEQLRRGEVGAAGPLLDAPVHHGEGVEGRALQTSTATIVDDPAAVLAAPLVAEERVLGLLTLVRPDGPPFGSSDAERVGSLVGQGAVAIENARLHRLIQKQAKTDSLTGLLNRREFEEQLGREVERGQRFSTPVGLVVLDLDDFKLVNDRFGHLAGDAVLKAAALAIQGCTRDIDQAARWGGEEFAVILPHTDVDGAARLAERLRQAIAERPVTTPDGRSIRVTASLGVSALPADAVTQVELTAAADAAVYRAKRAGKNRVCLAADDGSDTAPSTLTTA